MRYQNPPDARVRLASAPLCERGADDDAGAAYFKCFMCESHLTISQLANRQAISALARFANVMRYLPETFLLAAAKCRNAFRDAAPALLDMIQQAARFARRLHEKRIMIENYV